jgi:hypothetical protein
MRKKITIGFLSLALLLLFAGAVSVYELNRHRTKAQDIIELGVKNAGIAERMLSAMEMQNSAVIRLVVSETAIPGPDYERGAAEFKTALYEAAASLPDKTAIGAISKANDDFHRTIAGYTDEELLEKDMEWLTQTYLDAYYNLAESVMGFLLSPHSSFAERTVQLEMNVYKTITPSIITLATAIFLVLLFLFFMDRGYAKPLQKLNKGLKGYLETKIPFDDSFESSDDISSLKEMISDLIEQSRKQNKP